MSGHHVGPPYDGQVYDSPLLPYAGTSGHSGGATSEKRARRDDADETTSKRQRRALGALDAHASWGRTWKELAEVTGWHHGQASGVLSVLHKEGRIARLTERRQRCFVYVLPEYVNGRETQEHGHRSRKPATPVLTAQEEGEVYGAQQAIANADGLSGGKIPVWRAQQLLAIIERIVT